MSCCEVCEFPDLGLLKRKCSSLGLLLTWAEAAFGGLAVGICITKAVDNAGLLNVVGAHFHFYSVPHCYFNKVLTELPGDMSENLVAVGEFNPKHGSGEDGDNFAFYFYDVIVIGHKCEF